MHRLSGVFAPCFDFSVQRISLTAWYILTG